MLAVHEFSSAGVIDIQYKALSLSAALEEEVNALWQAERRRRGGSLFNGQIVSAVEISAERVACRIAEYRHFIAQTLQPGLFEDLQLRPVGVSGVIVSRWGVVFGKRGRSTTQDAGKWELVPSGGVEAKAVQVGDRVDHAAQLLTELHQETGVSKDQVRSLRTLCLVEDLDSHVLDIGTAIELAPSARRLIESHRPCGAAEYERLRILAIQDAFDFIERQGDRIVAVSTALLRHYATGRAIA